MADISLSLNGISVAFTLADADMARIFTAYTALFTQDGADGTPAVPDAQAVVLEIGKGVVAGIAQNAIRHEQEQAAKAAADAVPSIDATLVV